MEELDMADGIIMDGVDITILFGEQDGTLHIGMVVFIVLLIIMAVIMQATIEVINLIIIGILITTAEVAIIPITEDQETHTLILPEVVNLTKLITIQDPETLQITTEIDKGILKEELMQQVDLDLQIIITTDHQIVQTLVPDQR
ncbi:hypothetical protein GCM10007384_21940 [Aquimarina muelleri]|uniref:Uncharacterized protein n=1 Tax=Aquimarina muelleri TaxID=279356 RepID=A0A918JY69_9FLAO|nr:hypothetical protein GCM10007384_21940 [Aquimarina muelleri]